MMPLEKRIAEVFSLRLLICFNNIEDLTMFNIQIFGTKKCSDTRKAERFFKERSINFQFRDLAEKGIAKGELENIRRSIPLDDLLDKESKHFKKRNLSYMVFNTEEELLDDPLLFKTPIVRNGKLSTIGYAPHIWKEWIK
jgi:arsenate reductase-like glutaredoxin family protein